MSIVAVGVEMPPETSPDVGRRAWTRIEYGSEAARRLVQRHGLDSLDRLFELGCGTRQRHAGRAVFSQRIVNEDGLPVRLFVKLQEGLRRLWPRMNDLKSGQWLQSLARREWNGILRLEQLGIPAPERIALLHSTGWSLWFRSAVLVREVRPPSSIDEMLADGRWHDLARADQNEILDVVVATLRRIHAARLGWRGSSSRHFYPERDATGSWRTWLIDCEGIHRFAGPKVFRRNFDKLVRAFRESGADDDTLARLQQRIETRRSGIHRAPAS